MPKPRSYDQSADQALNFLSQGAEKPIYVRTERKNDQTVCVAVLQQSQIPHSQMWGQNPMMNQQHIMMNQPHPTMNQQHQMNPRHHHHITAEQQPIMTQQHFMIDQQHPLMNHQHPMISQQQQIHQQHLISTQQHPTMVYELPTINQQHPTRIQQHQIYQQHPVFHQQNPIRYQNHIMGQQNLTIDQQYPMINQHHNQLPMMNHQHLMMNNHHPMMNHQQPAYGYPTPGFYPPFGWSPEFSGPEYDDGEGISENLSAPIPYNTNTSVNAKFEEKSTATSSRKAIGIITKPNTKDATDGTTPLICNACQTIDIETFNKNVNGKLKDSSKNNKDGKHKNPLKLVKRHEIEARKNDGRISKDTISLSEDCINPTTNATENYDSNDERLIKVCPKHGEKLNLEEKGQNGDESSIAAADIDTIGDNTAEFTKKSLMNGAISVEAIQNRDKSKNTENYRLQEVPLKEEGNKEKHRGAIRNNTANFTKESLTNDDVSVETIQKRDKSKNIENRLKEVTLKEECKKKMTAEAKEKQDAKELHEQEDDIIIQTKVSVCWSWPSETDQFVNNDYERRNQYIEIGSAESFTLKKQNSETMSSSNDKDEVNQSNKYDDEKSSKEEIEILSNESMTLKKQYSETITSDSDEDTVNHSNKHEDEIPQETPWVHKCDCMTYNKIESESTEQVIDESKKDYFSKFLRFFGIEVIKGRKARSETERKQN